MALDLETRQRSALTLRADDAGWLIRAFAADDKGVRGGQLRLSADLHQTGRGISGAGELKIRDFTLWGAPLVARIVSLASFSGLSNALSGKGVCAITLGDDTEALVRALQDRFPEAMLIGGDAEFERLVASVVAFVEAPKIGLDLPLDMRGTAFQQRVWQALRQIPAGSTASYADIARLIGAPKAVRAVAQACGANELAVAVPCHRVVRSDGALSGYRWGVERKRALLDRESGD